MAENFDKVGGNTSPSFEPSPSYERLIKLREESPDAFLLRTSEATRRALHHYERQMEREKILRNPKISRIRRRGGALHLLAFEGYPGAGCPSITAPANS